MTKLGRIGPKKCENYSKNDIFKNQPNFDLFAKCDIYMPIRPEISNQSMDTICFPEAFRPTSCFQNIIKHTLCVNLTLGRIQSTPKMSKSAILTDFHQSENLNLRASAHFNSAQTRSKTFEIHSPIDFEHLIPQGF